MEKYNVKFKKKFGQNFLKDNRVVKRIVDVSNIDDVKIGNEVILFGKELPVNEFAEMASTIGYEIVCGISPRVPRIIIGRDSL